MSERRLEAEDFCRRARRITHLFLDCDGVLTDGGIYLLPDGEEIKRFDIRDGHGITMWRRAGHKVAILSGRGSRSLEQRVEELAIEYLVQRTWNKLDSFKELTEKYALVPEEIAYMGDDVVDIPIMRRVSLAAAPAGAAAEVLDSAHVITDLNGGHGAVREFIEMLLTAQGRWDQLMQRYLT